MIKNKVKRILSLTMGVTLASGYVGNNTLITSAYAHENIGEYEEIENIDSVNEVSDDGQAVETLSVNINNTTDAAVRYENGVKYELKNDSYVVTGYEESVVDVLIPSQIDGIDVTRIKSMAFRNSTTLKRVVIPDTVTSIEDYTFEGCSALEEVVIPESVKSIGDIAFYGCSSLESIEIPNGVKSIGRAAFSQCSALKSVIMPESLTKIGDYAFCGCKSLISIVIPKNVTEIGECAFYGCTSLNNVELPSGVTKIKDAVFADCILLTDIEIKGDITSIGMSSFYNCTSLNKINIPETVKTIDNYAFYGCTSLADINIPRKITIINEGVFGKCELLTDIIIPDGVNKIDSYSFYGCNSLRSLTIPESVTEIGKDAFRNCNNKTVFLVKGEKSELFKNMIETSGFKKPIINNVMADEAGNGSNDSDENIGVSIEEKINNILINNEKKEDLPVTKPESPILPPSGNITTGPGVEVKPSEEGSSSIKKQNPTPKIEVTCTATYVGELLGTSKLTGEFINEYGRFVEGKLIWENPNMSVISEVSEFRWVFVPYDLDNYNIVKGTLIVNATNQTGVKPIVDSIYAEDYYKLDEFKKVTGVMLDPNTKEQVIGTFRITNKAPKVYTKNTDEDVEITWKFIPYNNTRYVEVEGKVTAKAKMRYMELSNVKASNIKQGGYLYESVVTGEARDRISKKEISGVWRWSSISEKLEGSVNLTSDRIATFIPNLDNVYMPGSKEVKVNVQWENSNKQKDVKIQMIDTTDITVGTRIGDSNIVALAFDTDTGETVKGKFEWINPSSKFSTEGVRNEKYIFIPTDLVKYKPYLGHAHVSIVSQNSEEAVSKKIKLSNVSATSLLVGQSITESKITGTAILNGEKVNGVFEWVDPSYSCKLPGVIEEAVRFKHYTGGESEYIEAYTNVEVKIYLSEPIQIRNLKLESNNKKQLNVQVSKKVTIEQATKLINVDGHKIKSIELLAPSDSISTYNDEISLASHEFEKTSRSGLRESPITASDRIKVVTEEELNGEVRVKVTSDSQGNTYTDNLADLAPDFIINTDESVHEDASTNPGNGNGEVDNNEKPENNNGADNNTTKPESNNVTSNGTINSGNGSVSNISGGSSASSGFGSSGGSGGSSSSKESKDGTLSSAKDETNVENKVIDDKIIIDNKIVVNAWAMVDNAWYLSDAQGNKIKSQWINNNGSWYYLSETGAMKIGWHKDFDGKWYYLNNSGAMATGWIKDTNNKWYFLNDSGAMATGWIKEADNKWYYLNENGDMHSSGWKMINNKWYYFYENGEMASSTTVSGYKLGNDGAWI